MIKNFIKLFLIIFVSNSSAGELTVSATVVEVASNGAANSVNFGVKVEGGVGICTGWIFFPQVKNGTLHLSEATYSQAFTLATMALATGNPVRIHNYTGNNCNEADFISVSK